MIITHCFKESNRVVIELYCVLLLLLLLLYQLITLFHYYMVFLSETQTHTHTHHSTNNMTLERVVDLQCIFTARMDSNVSLQCTTYTRTLSLTLNLLSHLSYGSCANIHEIVVTHHITILYVHIIPHETFTRLFQVSKITISSKVDSCLSPILEPRRTPNLPYDHVQTYMKLSLPITSTFSTFTPYSRNIDIISSIEEHNLQQPHESFSSSNVSNNTENVLYIYSEYKTSIL